MKHFQLCHSSLPGLYTSDQQQLGTFFSLFGRRSEGPFPLPRGELVMDGASSTANNLQFLTCLWMDEIPPAAALLKVPHRNLTEKIKSTI